jgi:5-methylcytosine-specific restriction endonuclease McrA
MPYADDDKNRASIYAYTKEHRATDRGYAENRACTSRHAAMRRGAVIDPDFKDAILASILLTRENCERCGAPTPLRQRTIDHKLAIALGGTHTEGNIQILCYLCHAEKSKDETETSRRHSVDERIAV